MYQNDIQKPPNKQSNREREERGNNSRQCNPENQRPTVKIKIEPECTTASRTRKHPGRLPPKPQGMHQGLIEARELIVNPSMQHKQPITRAHSTIRVTGQEKDSRKDTNQHKQGTNAPP